jgi:hypothetical protein
MLLNLSNAALSEILWVIYVFTKNSLCNMLGIPVFNIDKVAAGKLPSIPVCWMM